IGTNSKVTVLPGGTVDRTSRLASLIMTNSTSTLDLNDNDLVLDYTGVSPLPAIRGSIRVAYHGGAWNFPGMLRSRAAPTPNPGESGKTALGYGEASVLHLSSFDGLSVSSGSLLIKYTYFGDADLDGDADGVDIGTWATNFTGELGGLGSKVWTD